MPLASIDTREHFDENSLMRRRHCLGKDIRVFTDGSYKQNVDGENGGFGVYLESDAMGMAARMDIPAHFHPSYYAHGHNNKAELPVSLGTNVLLIELVAIHEALNTDHTLDR